MINKSIQIKNVYYMLSYAFRVLKQNNFENVDSEEFDNIYNLLSEIIYRGVASQLKQGLYKEYINTNRDIPTVRGKINIKGSIPLIQKKSKYLNCDLDEFSVNNLFNKILKSTIFKLIRIKTISKDIRDKLTTILPYFDGIDLIEFESIPWNKIVFTKNNKTYQMLINICYFVSKNMIMTETKGEYKLATFTDDQMNLVFQNFVMNYYKELIQKRNITGNVRAAKVNYGIDKTKEYRGIEFLPDMQTDITVSVDSKTLIIDTKFYGKVFVTNREKSEYHSTNLTQITNYVMHHSYNHPDEVTAGMLLYAKTDEDITPNTYYNDMNHWFYIQSLDLNNDFTVIKDELDRIFDSSFKMLEN